YGSGYRSALSPGLCGPFTAAYSTRRDATGDTAHRQKQFLRHRLRPACRRQALDRHFLPRQSRQGASRPTGPEPEHAPGTRRKDGLGMRIVVKFAGALLEDASMVRALAQQVAALALQKHEILVVHGGGRIFTNTLKRLGIESRFVNGLRVTDKETRDAAVMVFAGLLNKQLSGAISAAGQPAIGISAADAHAFLAEPLVHNEVAGSLGFVGYLTGLNKSFIESLWQSDLVPVAACLGIGSDNELYNINADHMAAACAEYLGADQLIYLTDVAGVLEG